MSRRNRSNKGKRVLGESSSMERYDSDLFVSEEAFDKYEAYFKHRVVNLGRKVVFDDFDTLGLREIFAYQEWDNLCMMDVRVFPELIRMFYANLKVKHLPDNQIEIHSLVKGQELVVTENVLCGVCEFTAEGPRIFEKKSIPVCDMFDRNTTIRMITGLNELPPLFRVKANHLTPLARISHHIIGSIILPKAGHKDEISNMEILLLDRLLNHRKLNLGYVILKNMVENSRSRNSNLFYGMIIQKILDIYKVDNEGETYVSLKPKDAYSEASVKKMGLVQRANGNWVFHRRGVQQVGEDEEEEEGEEGQDQEHDSLDLLRRDFNEFRGSIFEHVSQVNSTANRVATVQEEHFRLQQEFQRQQLEYQMHQDRQAEERHHQTQEYFRQTQANHEEMMRMFQSMYPRPPPPDF